MTKTVDPYKLLGIATEEKISTIIVPKNNEEKDLPIATPSTIVVENPSATEDLLAIKINFISDYEKALLNIAFKNKVKLTELQSKITSDYFLYQPNKIIYTALCTLGNDPEIISIDVPALVKKAEEYGFQKTGLSSQYFLVISSSYYNEENFDFYLRDVTDAYCKYQLYLTLKEQKEKLLKNAKSEDKNLSGTELVSDFSTALSKLNLKHGSEDEVIEVHKDLRELVIERAEDTGEIAGLLTGLPSLDKAINGLMPGKLTVIAGKAKSGKSTFMGNIVRNVAIPSRENLNPVPVLIISTEMTTSEDAFRLLSMVSHVPERLIANGTAYRNPEYKEVLEAGISAIEESKIYHVYLPDFSAESVCNLIQYYKLKYNIELAVFDYIKMETIQKDENRGRREDQILGDVTTALKNIAGKLNIHVLTGCQVNTRTGLIADSDRIARYCDTLVAFNPKGAEEVADVSSAQVFGTHDLCILYARGGVATWSTIPVTFYKQYLLVLEAQRRPEASGVQDALSQVFSRIDPQRHGMQEIEDNIQDSFISDNVSEEDELFDDFFGE